MKRVCFLCFIVTQKSDHRDEKNDCQSLRRLVHEHAQNHGITSAMNAFGVSFGFARYWRDNFGLKGCVCSDGDCDTVPVDMRGGSRNVKFDESERKRIESVLEQFILSKPTSSLRVKWSFINYYQDVVAHCNKNGIELNDTWVSRAFRRMRFTQKVINHKQKHKYTDDNVAYFVEFVQALREEDKRKIKYCDESHFNSRGHFPTFQFYVKMNSVVFV